jgi:cobalt-zinc-cadmium efflux system outer membrane protein
MKMRSILPAVVVIVSGCSAPKASLDHVQATVAERTGKRVHWNRGGAEDAQIEQGVRTSLRRELTAESAVQIALLNNRDLQARFEEIGISQADLIEAGLLSNPSFAASFRFPNRPPSGTTLNIQLRRIFWICSCCPCAGGSPRRNWHRPKPGLQMQC